MDNSLQNASDVTANRLALQTFSSIITDDNKTRVGLSEKEILNIAENTINDNLRESVLDHGFVAYEDHIGTDRTIVNSARISFNKKTDKMNLSDEHLVQHLWEAGHHSTIRHCWVSFRVKAPIVVLRQWFKHRIGNKMSEIGDLHIDGSETNEISARYVKMQNQCYIPDEIRIQSKDNKQASYGVHPESELIKKEMEDLAGVVYSKYNDWISRGVPREQARFLAPQSQYTEIYWTASLQALFHFIQLRDDDHAQWEIRQYAVAIRNLLKTLYPVAMDMFQRKTFDLKSEFGTEHLMDYEHAVIMRHIVEKHCKKYGKATISLKGIKYIDEDLIYQIEILKKRYDVNVIRVGALQQSSLEKIRPYCDQRYLDIINKRRK